MENLKRLFILLAFSAILFCSAVYADPEYCEVNGSGEGALAFSRNNGVYFTSFGNSITVDSASNRFSYVLPLNTSLFATPAFTDKDYELNNGIYSETTSGFTSIYNVSVFGHPRISPTEVSTYTEMATCGNGGYDTLDEYLQENCSIKIYEPGTGYHTLFSGAQIDSSYFVQLLPSEDD